MAGHSHSANVAIRKGAVDKKRGALFGKLSRAIIVAARNGGGDTAINLRLRYAIDKARQSSMPKENIERAIKKGCGELEGEDYVELQYEGYGAAGVAIMADILTENRNRTAGEVRKIFEVHGGNLGASGCVAWMFERKGLFLVPAANIEEDRLIEAAVSAGADDVKQSGSLYEVTCDPAQFDPVKAALDEAKVPCDSAEITRIARNTVDLDFDAGVQVLKLISALNDHDDVQAVTANYNIPDEILEAVMAAVG
jgi:YebC/PmpR family DNA-binding regulatory protein